MRRAGTKDKKNSSAGDKKRLGENGENREIANPKEPVLEAVKHQ